MVFVEFFNFKFWFTCQSQSLMKQTETPLTQSIKHCQSKAANAQTMDPQTKPRGLYSEYFLFQLFSRCVQISLFLSKARCNCKLHSQHTFICRCGEVTLVLSMKNATGLGTHLSFCSPLRIQPLPLHATSRWWRRVFKYSLLQSSL